MFILMISSALKPPNLPLDRMTHLFSELGLQSSLSKDTPPTHTITCLRISVNRLTMTLTIPEFRLHKLQHLLSLWLDKTHFSKRKLQQLLGKLAFVTAFTCLQLSFNQCPTCLFCESQTSVISCQRCYA